MRIIQQIQKESNAQTTKYEEIFVLIDYLINLSLAIPRRVCRTTSAENSSLNLAPSVHVSQTSHQVAK